ncbi:hypothetical protein V5O48_008986 [Marasmius crinis-equi]|uniref:Uncharacterized protein n=1 Tax=Marasmius crinis-equi TaxID=585013 RepID=A0ABR3FCD1_9AGAR
MCSLRLSPTAVLELLIFLSLFQKVYASMDLATCLQHVKCGEWGPIGLNNRGEIVNNSVPYESNGTVRCSNATVFYPDATAISYADCRDHCGAGSHSLDASAFAQEFSAWLLPYLALLSQLPFGSQDKWQNLLAVLLTVGSPALAAYSITITVLNDRWLTRLFSPFSYPNSREAVHVLSSLQQSPLRTNIGECLLPSLVVLPLNDEWWHKLARLLDYSHSWSISAASSITWVVVAYVLSVVDSFEKLRSDDAWRELTSGSQSIGSLWLWLLPVVICWLQLSPKCDNERVREVMDHVNDIAYVATDDQVVLASRVNPHPAIHISDNDDQKTAILCADQYITVPIYNYSRLFTWTSAVQTVAGCFAQATRRAKNCLPVNSEVEWVPGGWNVKVRPENRSGTSFQIEAYCFPTPDVQAPQPERLGSSVWSRMFVASLAALFLQWSTAGAAFWTVYVTPTKGLGCRSVSYLIYAVTSTVVMFMLVSSSILAHYAMMYSSQLPFRPCHGSYDGLPTAPPAPASVTRKREISARLSILLRMVGKSLAVCNAVWITLSCSLQLLGFYDSCYCDGGVIGLGEERAYVASEFTKDDISTVQGPWIGGVLLAVGTSVLFLLFINLMRQSPKAKSGGGTL